MRISDWSSTCALPICEEVGRHLPRRELREVDDDRLARPRRCAATPVKQHPPLGSLEAAAAHVVAVILRLALAGFGAEQRHRLAELRLRLEYMVAAHRRDRKSTRLKSSH